MQTSSNTAESPTHPTTPNTTNSPISLASPLSPLSPSHQLHSPTRIPTRINSFTRTNSLVRTNSLQRSPSSEDMANFQTFYIQYDVKYDHMLRKVMQQITKTYATFHYLQMSDQLSKQIAKSYLQLKLTKRRQTFAVLAPMVLGENPETFPQGCKKIILTEQPTHPDHLPISNTTDLEQLQVELIKHLQLDSVWVGLLYRIGTDVEEFESYMLKHEHFELFEVTFLRNFYKLLQTKLQDGAQMNRQSLDNCKIQTQNGLQFYNTRVQEQVRSKFNSRTVIRDITMHPYLHLLVSRSYFNLIYIEGQIIHRFNNFKTWTATHHPALHTHLTLDTFIALDDYIYSEFIFGCLKKVKKYINRTLDRQPYPELVRKNHKDIIRQFRPCINEYFLNICLVLKQRAACLKEAVGSIIVKNRNIISTGYNSTPMGTINCYNGGCAVCNNSEKMSTEVLSCRCLHAEYNCILTAGITQTRGATLYSSKLPCLWCCKLIIQGQLKEVICLRSKYSSLEYENMEMVKNTLKVGKVTLIEMDIHFND